MNKKEEINVVLDLIDAAYSGDLDKANELAKVASEFSEDKKVRSGLFSKKTVSYNPYKTELNEIKVITDYLKGGNRLVSSDEVNCAHLYLKDFASENILGGRINKNNLGVTNDPEIFIKNFR